MITANVVLWGNGSRSMYLDRGAADLAVSKHGDGTVHKLVEEAAILRKFDAYVPADQASSMRYRIAELEAQVARLQTAMRVIESSTHTSGGELFPVGPADVRYAEDGNTVIGIDPPWSFLDGSGPTLLDAIEDHVRKTGDDNVEGRA